MKKHLFSEEGKFYKANLHAHATGSDGVFTPEKMKKEFKKRGYSVLSITEHEILKDYTCFDDEDFIFINGYELSINDNKSTEWTENKCVHLNIYSSDKHNTKQVCYNPDSIWFAGDDVKNSIEYYGQITERQYTPEFINKVIAECNERGFIVCLNHPYWSLQEPEELCQYEGLYALEIYNTDCAYWGWQEYDIYSYDIMSRKGIRLGAQMADDNHNNVKDDEFAGTFGGFNMIKAKELTYDSIFQALKNKDFYCSQAPYIYDLYIENGEAHIICSNAKEIIMSTGIRHIKSIKAKKGEYITKASFKIDKRFGFIRFDVIDKNGKRANTRAYFADEWED